ncbi:MAG: hypothetical protein H0X30_13145 [Anaerolineae bacterium]|nr:hypothetical protein [Anaerolineae bacterium]
MAQKPISPSKIANFANLPVRFSALCIFRQGLEPLTDWSQLQYFERFHFTVGIQIQLAMLPPPP